MPGPCLQTGPPGDFLQQAGFPGGGSRGFLEGRKGFYSLFTPPTSHMNFNSSLKSWYVTEG